MIEVGNLDAVRDFSDVRDVVRAYLLLAREGRAGPGLQRVQRPRPSAFATCSTCCSTRSSVKVDVRLDAARLRPSDVPAQVGDPSRLRAATAWEPRIPLEETLADLLQDWRARVSGTAARQP